MNYTISFTVKVSTHNQYFENQGIMTSRDLNDIISTLRLFLTELVNHGGNVDSVSSILERCGRNVNYVIVWEDRLVINGMDGFFTIYRNGRKLKRIDKLGRDVSLRFVVNNREVIGILEVLSEEDVINISKRLSKNLILHDLYSDKGLVRDNNEDSALSISIKLCTPHGVKSWHVLAVADGVGGFEAGERASLYMIRNLLDYSPIISNDNPFKVFESIINRTHMEIQEYARYLGKSCGTTFTGCLITNNEMYIAHIGDSRVYIIDDYGIEQITMDHKVDAHTISQAVGVTINRIDMYGPINLKKNSYLLLTTDGLTDLVSNEEIYQIVMRFRYPKLITRKLVDLANEKGGTDNITVITAKII